MANVDKLIVCEDFYSIQGEGKTLGVPAVFLRLAGCNLRCPGFSYKHPETGEHLGCDTAHVWQRGERQSFSDIFSRWETKGWLEKLKQGAHLVVTGGEPTIQQAALTQFFHQLDKTLGFPVFIELETNATLMFEPEFLSRLNQINASPKLAHSGELKAYQPNVINQIASLDKTFFKFVLAKPTDIDEVIKRYVDTHKMDKRKIYLMPEGGTKKAIEEKQNWLADLCKQYTMNYSTRLHLLIWNEATGI